jgi:hypothetical protein
MILKEESRNSRREIYSSASCCNIKLIHTDPGSNMFFTMIDRRLTAMISPVHRHEVSLEYRQSVRADKCWENSG